MVHIHLPCNVYNSIIIYLHKYLAATVLVHNKRSSYNYIASNVKNCSAVKSIYTKLYVVCLRCST